MGHHLTFWFAVLFICLETQINIAINKQDCFAGKLYNVEHCVLEIKLYMERNMMNLNDDKTEFILFKTFTE